MLTSKQRQFLKGLAHHKKPVILVGHKGITDALLKETAGALHTHELIKARLPEGEGREMAEEMARGVGAEIVVLTGRIVVLYKRRPDEPTIELPRDASSPRGGSTRSAAPARKPTSKGAAKPARSAPRAGGAAKSRSKGSSTKR